MHGTSGMPLAACALNAKRTVMGVSAVAAGGPLVLAQPAAGTQARFLSLFVASVAGVGCARACVRWWVLGEGGEAPRYQSGCRAVPLSRQFRPPAGRTPHLPDGASPGPCTQHACAAWRCARPLPLPRCGDPASPGRPLPASCTAGPLRRCRALCAAHLQPSAVQRLKVNGVI